MRIIEPFTIYQCTRCNAVHLTLHSDTTTYNEHLGYADMHGVVKRYAVNDKLVWPIGVITLLYSVGFITSIAVQGLCPSLRLLFASRHPATFVTSLI
jgi:hypothetical protein